MTKNEFIQRVCIGLSTHAIDSGYGEDRIVDYAFLLERRLEDRAETEGIEGFFDGDTACTATGDGKDLGNEPIAAVISEVDRMDEEEACERRKNWPRAQKVGHAQRALHCCNVAGIRTVSDLVLFGYSNFIRQNNMGKRCADLVRRALEKLYGIKAW